MRRCRCNPWIRVGRAFSPWSVALSAPRALPWAGIGTRRWRLSIGARRWRLRPSAGCGFLGSVTTSAFLKTNHYPEDATRGYGIGRAFSPWAVVLSVPRALPWAGIGARRWRLRPSAGCGFLGASQLRLFLKLTHYQKPHLFCRIGRAFSPWAVALSVPRALPWAGMGARRWRLSIGRAFSPWAVALSVPRALPWAGMGARRWRLRPSAGCLIAATEEDEICSGF